MSLETLLEAAKFLENESEDAKITQHTESAAVCKQILDAQKSVSGRLATASPQAYVVHPVPLDSSCSAVNNQNATISEDENNNIFNPEVPAKPRDLIHSANAREASIPNADSLSKNLKHVHVPVSNARVISAEDSKVQQPSNMDPLFARARVAVKNASFGQNEGMLITPPRNITAAGIRGGVIYDQQLLYAHDASGLALPFALPSQRSSKGSDGGLASVVEGNLKVKSDRPVSIVPAMNQNAEEKPLTSIIKQFEPNPTMHQNRQLKRNVTLTHNQLEKNRRAHLKECFEALRAAIPRLGMRRASNLTILKAALKQVQIVKRKSAHHSQVLSQLKKEQEEKRKRQTALLNELRKTKSDDEIEAFLTVAIRKEVMEMPSISLLDSSQLSTSTASEAEDEEYNEIFFKSTQNQSLSASFRTAPSDIRPSSLQNHVIVAPASAVTASHITKVVATSQALSTAPQYQVCAQRRAISANPGSEPAAPKVIRSPVVTSQPMRLTMLPRLSQDENRVKKSPVRPHSSQPRRSATPTPSSDRLQFFPRFSMGSGGSPPLSATPKFDFYSKKEGAENVNVGTKQISAASVGDDPAGKSIGSQTGGQINSFVEAAARPLSTHSDSAKKVTDSALDSSTLLHRRTNVSLPLSVHHQSSTPDTVIVTSFSGYEVKVKYLNQSVTSTAGQSMRMYQDRGPVKKRPLHKALFGSQALNDSRAPSSHSSSPLGNRGGSELKMTSLYVGASATALDSLSRKEYSTSTSDHENDRESTFLGYKRKFSPSWRKGLASEHKEASEERNKGTEKKRPFHLHQYEAPDSNSKAQNEARRKTTFNLWDRKHHAITMTTATNWRGKQQLITSKSKSSSPQARNDVPIRPITGASLSQVSVTSSKNQTYSVSSPTLSAPTFSPRDVAATSLTSSIKSPLLASSQGVVKPVPAASLSTGAVPPGGPRLQQVHALPLQLPGSRIGYQLIQAPAPIQAVAKNPPLNASDVSALNLISASLSSVPTLFAPPSYVTVSSAGSSEGQKDATSEASTLMQQTALLAAQSNPLQLGQVPCVFPISCVMYPPGVPHNGVHLAALQPPNGKVLTPNNLTSMQLGMVEPLHPPAKRSTTPNLPPKPPSRNQSNGSASSATLSIDSADADTVRNDPIAKKPRIAEVTLPSVINPNSGLVPGSHPRLAQSQFFLPGSSGFMVAAPSSNGFSLPFNLLSYPVQAFSNPAVQQLALAGLPPAQALHGIGQGWSFPQTVVPGGDGANALASLSANANGNVARTSMARSGKVD